MASAKKPASAGFLLLCICTLVVFPLKPALGGSRGIRHLDFDAAIG